MLRHRKSDWYNNTIDVFSLGVTMIDYLLPAFHDKVSFDLNVLHILDAMLDYNKCIFSDRSGILCNNQEVWIEGFLDLEEIQRFFNSKNQKSCSSKPEYIDF